jgi:C1A family cysteine protease
LISKKKGIFLFMTEQERLFNLESEVNNIKATLTMHGLFSGPVPNPEPVPDPAPAKRSYGLRPDLPDQRDFLFSELNLKPTLPASIDLRATCSPIEDQGNLGSCTANALAGALEFLEDKDKILMTRMSRLFIYYNERALEGTVSSDSGAAIRDGIKSLIKQGCCPETEWPYVISKFASKPPTKCYTDGLMHAVQAYYRVQTLTDMKTCLSLAFPFVFGITVYSNFESAHATATGIIPIPAKHEQVLGGHALLCVGYNDTKQQFVFRNSWGTSWGDKGYGYIPYAYLSNSSLASDMWYISRAKGL